MILANLFVGSMRHSTEAIVTLEWTLFPSNKRLYLLASREHWTMAFGFDGVLGVGTR